MNKKFIVGIEYDMRLIDYSLRNWPEKLNNNPEIEIKFLSKERLSGPVRPEELKDIDVFIFMGKRYVNEKSLQLATDLKWIGRFGAGFENIDISACNQKGILVSNAPQGVSESVAEFILSFMLALSTKLTIFDTLIRKNNSFEGSGKHMTSRLFQKILGIIGFGSIGSRLSELIKPFKMKLLINDPYVDKKTIMHVEAESVDLDYLLRHSDFISLNVPLTQQTKGMLREEDFKKMKRTAYLINTCRGGIYHDADLAKALEEGWLAGVATDVFENEPHVKENLLLKVESHKTVLSPHIAGVSHNLDAINMTTDIITDSILKVKKGELPENILNPNAVDINIPKNKLSPSFI